MHTHQDEEKDNDEVGEDFDDDDYVEADVEEENSDMEEGITINFTSDRKYIYDIVF